jgi:hypothetical protein
MKRRSTKVSSQASRKGKRTRKKMEAARRDFDREIVERATPYIEAAIRTAIKTDRPISFDDYRRALPNPFLTRE